VISTPTDHAGDAAAIDETERRRAKQLAYNEEHGITPQTVQKAIRHGLELEVRAHKTARQAIGQDTQQYDTTEMIAKLEQDMLEAAEALEFEKAAGIRDRLKQLRSMPTSGKVTMDEIEPARPKAGTPGTKVFRKTKKKRR
jgi:excinuclease ABC subunit B